MATTTPRRMPPGASRIDLGAGAAIPQAETQNGSIAVEEAQPEASLLATALIADTRMAAPKEQPPPQAIAVTGAALEEGIGAWLSDKRVNALWSINQNRNVFMGVTDVGWKKLANNSDSAIVAFTILSSHAKATGSRIDCREEADGMVHECYVW